MEGSSTLKEKALAAVTENFKGKKHLKVKSKSVQLRTKTKNKSSGAKVSSTVALTARRIKTRKKKEKAKASAASQPLAMVAMINKELPETVRKNMDSPGLVNRTGRFAESVRVTDVIQTPKGFPSFGYKYQMNPYQVFEDGGNGSAPWANGNRDPRGLIDRSIREIAKDLAIGRFYTRRV